MCHFVANYLEVIGLVASGQSTSQTPLDVTNSHHESIDATCTSPRLAFVTIMTTHMMEEDALTWASNLQL